MDASLPSRRADDAGGAAAAQRSARPIIALADIRPGDLPLVGAKAYRLGLLLQAGYAVAPGFCLSTSAWRQLPDPWRAAPLQHAPLRATLLDAYRACGMRAAAVRSSAVVEDGEEASWAGIFTTVLDVRGEDALLDAAAACYASARSPVARAYRRRHGRAGDDEAMAVLIQEMVDADVAGVLFTADPMTRSSQTLLVNAVPGLGEPLAAGRVSGDSFVIDPEGRLIAEQICVKRSMLRGGCEIALPAQRALRPALERTQLVELARLGRSVERLFGAPQDVEFAIAGGRIHLLQSRPIPRHGAAPPRDDDGALRRERGRLARRVARLRKTGVLQAPEAVFSNGNIGELLPTPTPMSFGLFRKVFASRHGAIVTGRQRLGYRLDGDAARPLYELICGQAYFNVEVDAATFDIGLPFDRAEHVARVVADPQLANYPETGLYAQRLSRTEALARFGAAGERHHRLAEDFRGRMARHAQTFLRAFSGALEPALAARLARQRPGERRGCTAEDLSCEIAARIDALRRGVCVDFVVAARIGFFFADMVRLTLGECFGDESAELWPRLLQGLPGSRITEQMIDLERVAAGRLSRSSFLGAYGHLASNELELSLPRIVEDADAVERMLRDLAASGRRPGLEFRRQIETRMELEGRLKSRLRGSGPVARLFDELRMAQRFLPLRETLKYHYAVEYAAIRAALLQLAPKVGLEPDDMFYLEPGDLARCVAARPGSMRGVIELRRRRRRWALQLAHEHRMPDVIIASRLDQIGQRRPPADASRALVGRGVAPGVAVGVVRVVDPGAAGRGFNGDEILVARAAGLGLAPSLRVVAGLIVEVGGILAHGACQAREAGIPAVVLEGATALLQDGAAVRIDGDRGTVTVLSAASRENRGTPQEAAHVAGPWGDS